MVNARLYRAAMLPCLIALALAAFSLQSRPGAYSTTLAPDAFEGAQAFRELQRLSVQFPSRRPGGSGDEELAGAVKATIEGLGGAAGGGFSVRSVRVPAQTIDGQRTVTDVIAQRPGSTDASALLVVAHRDAAAPGSAAELSGTAVLLELARVFAARETKRSVVLVSTSGGSGGDTGAAQIAGALQTPIDAAIVLGDLAGNKLDRPLVVPYSDSFGSAPLQLQSTVANAIAREAGVQPGYPSTLGQFAHLAVPIAPGEQGVIGAQGIPAVLVQASGERGPASREAIGRERLEGLGRAVLSSMDALDGAEDVPRQVQTSLPLAHKSMPEWAAVVLALALLLAPLVAVVDGLARMRRRRLRVARWSAWTLAWALPFAASALLARMLGALGALSAPAVPVVPAAVPFGARGAIAAVALAVTFALGCFTARAVARRLRCSVERDADAAALPLLAVLLATALIVLLSNPYAALLFVPALHLWLLFAEPRARARRGFAIAALVLGLAPAALIAIFYAHQLGLAGGGLAWSVVLLFAGGHIGLGAMLVWSVAAGCALAATRLALAPPRAPPASGAPERDIPITIRGPLSYAGPGSLGGTESALRR